MPVSLALERLWHDYLEFTASLGYIVLSQCKRYSETNKQPGHILRTNARAYA